MDDETGMTPHERRTGARYMREFGVGMALFLVLFLLLPAWWETESGTWPHLARTLLPILPLIWAVLAIWRHIRSVDEMQRAVLISSLAFGFAVTILTVLVVALLRGSGIDIPRGEWIIFIAGMTSWSIALLANATKSNR